MPALTEAALSDAERTAVDAFVDALRERLGDGLRTVWLYGSRARGDSDHADSDVDLLVVTDGGRTNDFRLVTGVLWDAAEAAGADPALLSAVVMSPERVENRRSIRSFFMQEVDRDKIVRHGEP